ncbi:HlyC/CorC family transporter [bacterium]|nr:HlyC/CorC family transporter [bacterium]
MEIEIGLAFIGLILSAYFSGSEIAYISANPLQMQIWESQKIRGAGRSLKYLENKEEILSVILVGNTLANMLATSFATVVLLKNFQLPYWAITLMVALVILVFGELIPKSLIRIRANNVTRYISLTMHIVEIVLLPLTRIARFITMIALKLVRSKHSDLNAVLTRDEFKHSLHSGHESGVIDEQEQEYIRNVMEFSDITADEIKTPRTDIEAISEEADLREAKMAFEESGYSKILVYRESIDEIIGFIVLHDLFHDPENIKEITRDISLYPQSKNIFEMLKDFQENNISIALLVDEFGGTSGIVTMEDLVEEIFGEFEDEYDEDAEGIRLLSNGDFIVEGRCEIDDLNEQLPKIIAEGEYETLAGYLLDSLNRFPPKNEKIIIDGLEYTILRSTAKSIDLLRIHPIKG